MIDPDRLDPDAREVWDEMFPGGFWAGAPHKEGPRFRLWDFAQVCQFELGRVPAVIDEAVTPEERRDIGQAIGEYLKNRREGRVVRPASDEPGP